MKQKILFLKSLLFISLLFFLIGIVNGKPFLEDVYASEKKESTITIQEFTKKLEQIVKVEKNSLIKKGEFKNKKKKITWKQVAVLVNRADEFKNGTNYDENLYKQVVEKKRLTGLTGLTTEEKKAVRLCFIKGIISGVSNGNYSQSRHFYANQKVTTKEANKILECLKDKKKRTKLSPDGQVVRTTNLPSNYKKFDYILESFPNQFYEVGFSYQYSVCENFEPKNLEHYACPKDMKKLNYDTGYFDTTSFLDIYEICKDVWIETIETNLKCRFNFDYQTVDEEWISKLASTYVDGTNANENKNITDSIKKYIKTAKKNHVIIKADTIAVEPSTIYYESGWGFLVRCHIKFKVNADTIYSRESGRQNELLYAGSWQSVWIKNLKKNEWYEMDIDMAIGQQAGNQNPSTYKILDDSLCPRGIYPKKYLGD